MKRRVVYTTLKSILKSIHLWPASQQSAEEVICDEREAAATLAHTEPAVTAPDTHTEAAEAAEGICDHTQAPPLCHHKEPALLRGRATEEGGIEVAAVGIQVVCVCVCVCVCV
jgi:hypothetical protein